MSEESSIKHSVRGLGGVWRYLLPYSRILALVIVALCITSGSVLAMSQSLRYVIDYGLSRHDASMLDHSLVGLLAIILVLGVSTAGRYYLITFVGERVAIDMRRDIYRHILKLSADFYESHKLGDILARITSDTSDLQNLIGSSISVALRNIVMLLGGIITMLAINAKLFVLLMLAVPLIVAPIVLIGRYVRYYSRLSQDKLGEVAAHAEETIAGIKTIQAYCQEEFEQQRFDQDLFSVLGAALTRIRYRALVTMIVIVMVFGGIAYVLWVGGHDVLMGKITPGELSSFLFLGVVCAGAVGALAEVTGDLQKAAGAAERILEFLHFEPSIKSNPNALVLLDPVPGRICIQRATFFYESRPDKPILQDISFEIAPNKVTAIVGESGAGKSTILQLLLRFYDLQSGVITFDGTNIQGIELHSLRQQFAYVAQDPIIFSTTIYDNVCYGNSQASMKQVRQALQAAAALEFVERLPEGMHTYLGEKGVRLSGGQKQRIVIARAFLKNPKILLLDEATSSLDSGNETLVRQALESLMIDRTVVVVAHRLATIVNADKIIVIKDGQVLEQGRHEALLAKGGEYSKLFSKNGATA